MKKFREVEGIRVRKSNFSEMQMLAAKTHTADDCGYVFWFQGDEDDGIVPCWGIPQSGGEINDPEFDVDDTGFGVDIVEVSKVDVREKELIFDHKAGDQSETFPDDVDKNTWVVVDEDGKPMLCGIATVYGRNPEELEKE